MFWYDTDGQFEEDVDKLQLGSAKVLRLTDRNALRAKMLLEHEDPEGQYLVYAEQIPYYIITGSTPKEERMGCVRASNEGEVPVFLISLKAGGTGLNLVGADSAIHFDPWWNTAAENQASDHAHRIRQTKAEFQKSYAGQI